MNEGICRAAGEYIYLTEDDMITAPEAIGEMVAYMRRDPQAAIVSGVHHDDRGALIHAGGFITLGSTYSQFLIGRDTPVPPRLHGPFCATYATGAMMMLRRSVIEELGAFREDFFMYFEDVELCARYLRSGKTVVIVPTARAETFADSDAGRPSPAVEFHKFKNLLTVNLLHAPAKVLPEFLARYAGLNLLRSLRAGRRLALEHLRANLWVAARLPRLLRQRRSFASRHGGSRRIAKFPRQQSERV
jgi:GT2 family glycosyltransferase